MILPIVFLVFGVLCGKFLILTGNAEQMELWIFILVAVVVFTAGIDVGAKKIIFRKLGEYRAKILLIPLGTVFGSLLGGVLAGFLMGVPINEAAAVSAGFGYYSLSAGLLTNLGGAGLGALAFVTNLFREMLSFLVVPLIARYISYHGAIAPGGATSMDTTLGIIARSTNGEITMMAMIHGVVLTALVPVFVPFLYRL